MLRGGQDVWVLIHDGFDGGFMLAVYPRMVEAEGVLMFGDGERERGCEIILKEVNPDHAVVELVGWEMKGDAALRPLTNQTAGEISFPDHEPGLPEWIFRAHLLSNRSPDWRPPGWAD